MRDEKNYCLCRCKTSVIHVLSRSKFNQDAQNPMSKEIEISKKDFLSDF